MEQNARATNFSRFKSIQIDLGLHFTDRFRRSQELNDTVRIGVQPRRSSLKDRTHLLEDLAAILSGSPSLKVLESTVSVEALALRSSNRRSEGAIWILVADAFIESGILYPLEALTNIEEIDLKVAGNVANIINCSDDMCRKVRYKTAKVEELEWVVKRKIISRSLQTMLKTRSKQYVKGLTWLDDVANYQQLDAFVPLEQHQAWIVLGQAAAPRAEITTF